MNDDEMRAELEAQLRKRFEPAFERFRARQAEEDALNDDEWWELRRKRLVERNPLFAERVAGMKEGMLEARHLRGAALDADELEKMLSARTEEILPVLLEVRAELAEDGPLTQDQFHRASVESSRAKIASMLKVVQSAVGKQTDPLRRDLIARFADNITDDLEDMKMLSDPSITQEQLDEVTSKIRGRINNLFKPLGRGGE